MAFPILGAHPSLFCSSVLSPLFLFSQFLAHLFIPFPPHTFILIPLFPDVRLTPTSDFDSARRSPGLSSNKSRQSFSPRRQLFFAVHFPCADPKMLFIRLFPFEPVLLQRRALCLDTPTINLEPGLLDFRTRRLWGFFFFFSS